MKVSSNCATHISLAHICKEIYLIFICLLLEWEDNFCEEYCWSWNCQAGDRGCVKVSAKASIKILPNVICCTCQSVTYIHQVSYIYQVMWKTCHREEPHCSSREWSQNLWDAGNHIPALPFLYNVLHFFSLMIMQEIKSSVQIILVLIKSTPNMVVNARNLNLFL